MESLARARWIVGVAALTLLACAPRPRIVKVTYELPGARPDYDHSDAVLLTGDRIQLVASVQSRARPTTPLRVENDSKASPGAYAWSSSDTSVARVSSEGVLGAVGMGRSTITARATGHGVTGGFLVRVGTPRLARLTLAPRDTTVTVGDTLTVRVDAADPSGGPIRAVPVDFEVRPIATDGVAPRWRVLRSWAYIETPAYRPIRFQSPGRIRVVGFACDDVLHRTSARDSVTITAVARRGSE
jgi:hypothetical protein